MLDSKEAMKIFEKSGIDKAFEFVADKDPTLGSKLWKQLQATTDLVGLNGSQFSYGEPPGSLKTRAGESASHGLHSLV